MQIKIQNKIHFLIAIFFIVIGFFIMLFFFENHLIYLGTQHSNPYRASALEKLNKIGFKQDFKQLNNFKIEYFQKETKSEKNILFLGGNAEDVLFHIPFLNSVFENHNIYTLNYPTYGGSEGYPNEENITQIISEFIQYKKLNTKNLILMGRSLGTGFATITASKFNNTEKLILVSPYYSLENVAISHYPFVPKVLTDMFMENKIETYKFAEKIKISPLIIFAKDDLVVFEEHTERLTKYFKNPTVIKFENENHDSVLTSNKTILKIKEYIN